MNEKLVNENDLIVTRVKEIHKIYLRQAQSGVVFDVFVELGCGGFTFLQGLTYYEKGLPVRLSSKNIIGTFTHPDIKPANGVNDV